MITGTELLEALPVAVYTTDAEGRITFYNRAAAELWGHHPELGSSQWCGSWRLYWPGRRALPPGGGPRAVAPPGGPGGGAGEAPAPRAPRPPGRVMAHPPPPRDPPP